jgi:hypothetical protein
MCLRRAPEKHIAGAASDRAGLELDSLDVSQISGSPRTVTGAALRLSCQRGRTSAVP